MSLLMLCIILLIVVGIACAIAYYIPANPPLAWLKWAIPVVALLFALVVIVQKAGLS